MEYNVYKYLHNEILYDTIQCSTAQSVGKHSDVWIR